MLRALCLCGLSVIPTLVLAQTVREMEDLLPIERFPDVFYEVTCEQEGWGVTTGWVHSHWTGAWEASGETQITQILRISTFCDPDLRLPPVMEELTLRRDQGSVAVLRIRSITSELPAEVMVMPPGTWAAPFPLEEGNEWVAGHEQLKSWTRVVAVGAANPNPLIEPDALCARTMSVTAERRARGLVALSVAETWWLPGYGAVQIEEASEVRAGLTWDDLTPESLADFTGETESMPQHASLRLMPPVATADGGS